MTDEDTDRDWYSNETATLGDRLADARLALNLTQEDLAGQLGVKLRTLQSWEDDVSEPRANRLQMLAGLLNVSLRWLLTGDGEGIAPPIDEEIPAETVEIMGEMRRLQADIAQCADRLGRLEKRLRLAVAAT